jgi:pimeloyl-ACP methyl ester carboxylesterase
VTPDFNEPDFSTLTVSRMLAQVGAEIDMAPEPVALIGSSLGAFVAVNAAAREPARVDRVILLAPALDFGGNRMRDLGDRGLEEWRRTDTLQVFHYGYGRLVPVHYELYSDATKYDAFNARVEQPVLIFQGARDTSVEPATVERWATARSNVELHFLDDDHQLLSSLDVIWAGSARFLGVAAS